MLASGLHSSKSVSNDRVDRYLHPRPSSGASSRGGSAGSRVGSASSRRQSRQRPASAACVSSPAFRRPVLSQRLRCIRFAFSFAHDTRLPLNAVTDKPLPCGCSGRRCRTYSRRPPPPPPPAHASAPSTQASTASHLAAAVRSQPTSESEPCTGGWLFVGECAEGCWLWCG